MKAARLRPDLAASATTTGSARPFVVELVGPAGAGKTTLARRLLACGEGIGLAVPVTRGTHLLAAYIASALTLLPGYLARPGTQWFTRREVRAMAYLRIWHRLLTRRSVPGVRVVVFDHGPLFRLTLLAEFGPPLIAGARFRRWWDATLARWADRLDAVVVLDAPDDVLLPRIRSREQRHAVQDASDEEAWRLLGRYRAAYDMVLASLVATGQVALFRFDTRHSTPDAIAADVLAALHPSYAQGPGRHG